MDRLPCTVLFWISLVTLCVAPRDGPCPRGCQETFCRWRTGCDSCKPGYCNTYTREGPRIIGMCVRWCGSERYCHRANAGDVCRPCGFPHCYNCTEYRKCNLCQFGFRLVTTPEGPVCQKERCYVPYCDVCVFWVCHVCEAGYYLALTADLSTVCRMLPGQPGPRRHPHARHLHGPVQEAASTRGSSLAARRASFGDS